MAIQLPHYGRPIAAEGHKRTSSTSSHRIISSSSRWLPDDDDYPSDGRYTKALVNVEFGMEMYVGGYDMVKERWSTRHACPLHLPAAPARCACPLRLPTAPARCARSLCLHAATRLWLPTRARHALNSERTERTSHARARIASCAQRHAHSRWPGGPLLPSTRCPPAHSPAVPPAHSPAVPPRALLSRQSSGTTARTAATSRS